MFRSEEPCAIAITLTCASAIDPKTRAAVPGVRAMPTPTTATVATPIKTSTESISPRSSSSENAARNCVSAAAAACSGTVKQIECSEDACEISETDMPPLASAPNVRAAMPGTPSIPLPATVTSACEVIAESARTGEPATDRPWAISVPSASGSANGRMRSVVPSVNGISARGCRTFAP